MGRHADMCVVGEAADGRQAIEQFLRTRPDVTLAHLCEPPAGGLDSVAALRKEFPHRRVVVLSGAGPGAEVRRALSAGVQSYLPRNARPDQLLEAIRAAHQGQRYIHASVASLLAESLAYPSLPKRELDVLRLIAQGVSNKRIGAPGRDRGDGEVSRQQHPGQAARGRPDSRRHQRPSARTPHTRLARPSTER